MPDPRIQAAVDAAIQETVGPVMAGFEAIRLAAAETSDDAALGRRARAIIDTVDAVRRGDVETTRDFAEARRAEAKGPAM